MISITLGDQNLKSADVGAPKLQGSASKIDDGFAITAGGADIWGTRDEFHFVYAQYDGDFVISIRIESLTAADPYTKAGIMARASLDEAAAHAYFQVFPDNSARNNNNGGYEYQYRLADHAEMKAIYPATSSGTPPFPVNYPDTWLRLVRRGNIFTGYFSPDGDQWVEYAALEISLPQTLLLGMAVTSHNPDSLASAKFRDMAVT